MPKTKSPPAHKIVIDPAATPTPEQIVYALMGVDTTELVKRIRGGYYGPYDNLRRKNP